METAAAIAILVAVIGAYIAYGQWLTHGIKPRVFTTRVPKEQLRDLFISRVAGSTWKIVDDGNPMVAQSPLISGIRQQISMELIEGPDGSCTVRVGPTRWVESRGVPTKAHTIRIRLNSFVKAVQSVDSSVTPHLAELWGR